LPDPSPAEEKVAFTPPGKGKNLLPFLSQEKNEKGTTGNVFAIIM